MTPSDSIRPIRERDSFLLVAAFAVLAVGVVVFSGIAGLTFGDQLVRFDRWALLAFRNPLDASDPLGSRIVENYSRDLTSLGGSFVLTLFTVVAVLFLLVSRRPRTAAFVAVVIAVNAAANYYLKLAFGRLRPDLTSADPHTMSPAFPSGHAQSAAAVYLTMAFVLCQSLPERRQRIFVFVVAGLMTLSIGVSRVYRGVHWPTDVLAGWTLGISWAVSCWLIYSYFQRRRRH